MRVIYQSIIINSQTYITGWWSSSDSIAVELSPVIEGITSWYDENNNPIWTLNNDGTITENRIDGTAIEQQRIATEADAQLNQEIMQSLIDAQKSLPEWQARATAITSALQAAQASKTTP